MANDDNNSTCSNNAYALYDHIKYYKEKNKYEIKQYAVINLIEHILVGKLDQYNSTSEHKWNEK